MENENSVLTLDYFFKAFEGADVSIIDVSNDKQWQQHSHEH